MAISPQVCVWGHNLDIRHPENYIYLFQVANPNHRSVSYVTSQRQKVQLGLGFGLCPL